MKSANALPIPEKEFSRFGDQAARSLMAPVKWSLGRRFVATTKKEVSADEERVVDVNPRQPVQEVTLGQIALRVGIDQNLFNEDGLHILHILRRGMMIGMYISDLYQKTVGLDELLRAREGLTPDRQSERQQKNQTAAAIQLFTAASYTLWRLSRYKAEEVSAVPMELGATPEVSLLNPPEAYQCLVFYLAKLLEHKRGDTRLVQSGPGAVKMALLYLNWVMDEIKLKADALPFVEAFTSLTYQLEGENFILNGFEPQAHEAAAVVEFKRVELHEIIGNHEMKRVLKRLAQFIIAYCYERQMNPFLEFDALNWIGVLQGWAGTGKSMGLSYLQTVVADLCQQLGLPFQICPIPNAIISSLQGDSAKAYETWWRQMSNPALIPVAPVDDAEAVYLDRRTQKSSEGSTLIVMSHLRLTEGSTASNKGNVLQPHASNNVDMIDPPVFSRYQFRVVVPGAQTREDFCDQMKIWGDRFNKKTGKPLVNLDFPPDYTFLSNQGLIAPDERTVEAFTQFKNQDLQRVWEDVQRAKLGHNSYDLYGMFFAALRKRFEQFTSRDVRNITVNTASRLFGFDFDTSWLENRDVFVAKDYDTKKAMILDAALQYQNGLTVTEVLFQEMVNYVEATIAMLDSGRQFRIRQQADQVLEGFQAQEIARGEWAKRTPQQPAVV